MITINNGNMMIVFTSGYKHPAVHSAGVKSPDVENANFLEAEILD